MSASMHPGTQGAKRQSFYKASPRGFLMKLITDNPGHDEAALLSLFTRKVQEDAEEDYLPAIIAYWFTGNYRSLTYEPPHTVPHTRAAKAAAIDEAKEKFDRHIHQEAQRLLLDMPMPNGRQLRHCTFGYCAKVGGALSRIAEKGRPRQEVGSVLSEGQVRTLYGRD